jgi:hypothetical protein
MLNLPLSAPKASMGHHTGALLASAAVVTMAFAMPAFAQTDVLNEWDVPTTDPMTHTFGPTGVEFDFRGDARACIPAQLSNVPLTNPWYAFTQWVNGGGTSNPITITYDVATNLTRVIESGEALDVPAPSGFPGPTNGNGTTSSYHVGLNQGFEAACVNNPLVKKRWIWARTRGSTSLVNAQYQDIAVPASEWTGVGENKGRPKFTNEAVIYVETIAPQASGTWAAVSYGKPTHGMAVTFSLTNYGGADITLGNAGIVGGLPLATDPECRKIPTCQENQELLYSLNDAGFPVSGPNSPFTLLPQLNGVTLAPGQSIDIQLP